jgi:beta-lactamase class C
MSAIGVNVPPEFKKKYAICYDQQGNKSIPWTNEYLIGSAAIKVSTNDMQEFLRAAIGLPGVPQSLLYAMRLTQLPYVAVDPIYHGLAWEITDIQCNASQKLFDWPVGTEAAIIPDNKRIFNPLALYEKGGTTNGFHAYIAVIPGKKSGIGIMLNKRRYNGWKVLKKLGREILLEEGAYA